MSATVTSVFPPQIILRFQQIRHRFPLGKTSCASFTVAFFKLSFLGIAAGKFRKSVQGSSDFKECSYGLETQWKVANSSLCLEKTCFCCCVFCVFLAGPIDFQPRCVSTASLCNQITFFRDKIAFVLEVCAIANSTMSACMSTSVCMCVHSEA